MISYRVPCHSCGLAWMSSSAMSEIPSGRLQGQAFAVEESAAERLQRPGKEASVRSPWLFQRIAIRRGAERCLGTPRRVSLLLVARFQETATRMGISTSRTRDSCSNFSSWGTRSCCPAATAACRTQPTSRCWTFRVTATWNSTVPWRSSTSSSRGDRSTFWGGTASGSLIARMFATRDRAKLSRRRKRGRQSCQIPV